MLYVTRRKIDDVNLDHVCCLKNFRVNTKELYTKCTVVGVYEYVRTPMYRSTSVLPCFNPFIYVVINSGNELDVENWESIGTTLVSVYVYDALLIVTLVFFLLNQLTTMFCLHYPCVILHNIVDFDTTCTGLY